MIRYIIAIVCSVLTTSIVQGQNVWKGKQAAVVLTYDDALNVHLDNAIPTLDSLGLKGTFFLSASAPGSKNRLEDWKKAAARGHELGNHTLFHPCDGRDSSRSWVSDERDLSKYTLSRMLDEIRMTNIFLQSLDTKTSHTFAYPCGDTKVGDADYSQLITNDFVASRGVAPALVGMDTQDFSNIPSFPVNGEDGDKLISWVKEALKNKKMIVFLFHGVGGEHSLDVDLKAHSQLLHFLKKHEKEIWTTTFIDAVTYIKSSQQSKK